MTGIANRAQSACGNTRGSTRPVGQEEPRRILLALHDGALLDEACAALEALGMEIAVADTVEEALLLQTERHCELILIDAALARQHAYAAIRHLRALGTRRIPLIACAAGMDEAGRNALLRADIDDVCAPPLVRTQLSRLLHLWLPLKEDEASCDSGGAGMRSVADLLGAGFSTVAQTFCRESAARLDALRSGLRDGNAEDLAGTAHALGGSSASIGAWRMAGLCRALELQCLAGIEGRLPQLMDDIEAEYRRQSHCLAQMIAAQGATRPTSALAR
ncbi:Hpt domain-containing response regulator [Noviherbaspirillum pedocola]|uniref:Response regulator n=1 Tax=Noviherbaspirillum pedocola TaxID=2801341 RepID=A0A934SM46_9BURK|nr:response regulator [Noviherbaspirillum pedocola]MBK4733096.1 response regulator [Noviherbaspirillum pedocola]